MNRSPDGLPALVRHALLASAILIGAGLSLTLAQEQVFRHAYGDSLGTLDPAATHTHMDWEIMFQVYDRLVGYEDGSLTTLGPRLATEVPSVQNGLISDDGRTFTFPLREGVTFHDGSDFTAEDVAYTFRRMIEMDVPQAKVQDNILPYISPEGIEVVDDYTVRLTLDEVNPGFLFALADPSASIVSEDFAEEHGGITPGEENEELRWRASGTGPFVLDEIEPPGQRIVLVKNDDYWGSEPTVDRIETQLVADPSTQILMLRSGDVDSIEVGKDQLRNVEGQPNVEIVTGMPAIRSHTIKFQTEINTDAMDSANTIPSDFFQDVHVRKGFAYAFPYQAYLDNYRAGDARYAGPIPNGMLGDSPNTPMYEYDPERAEEHFRQTEWWDSGFTITMYTLPNWDTWPEAISMLSQSLSEINPRFDVQQRAVEWATLVDMTENREIPLRVGAIRGVTADPDSIVRRRMYEGGWDTMGLDDPDINAMVDEAATEIDPERRAETYAELEEIAYDTAFMLWISQDSGFIVHRTGVEGLSWHPIYETWPSWRNVRITD